jgi:hypothetical protein
MNSRLTEWQKKVRMFMRDISGGFTPGLDEWLGTNIPARVLSFGDSRGIHPFVLCSGLAGDFAQHPVRPLHSDYAESLTTPGTDSRESANAMASDLADFIENNF